MAPDRDPRRPAGRVPDLEDPAQVGGCQRPAVRGMGEGDDLVFMSSERGPRAPLLAIPELDSEVFASRRQAATIGRIGQACDAIDVPLVGLRFDQGTEIPQLQTESV